MSSHLPIRLRVAACLENFDDGCEWSFYVLNDGEAALSRIVLETIEFEWGDQSELIHPNAEVNDLACQAHALLWRDNDIESRITLHLRVQLNDVEEQLCVKFPLLYRRKADLLLVNGLDRVGWTELATPALT